MSLSHLVLAAIRTPTGPQWVRLGGILIGEAALCFGFGHATGFLRPDPERWKDWPTFTERAMNTFLFPCLIEESIWRHVESPSLAHTITRTHCTRTAHIAHTRTHCTRARARTRERTGARVYTHKLFYAHAGLRSSPIREKGGGRLPHPPRSGSQVCWFGRIPPRVTAAALEE